MGHLSSSRSPRTPREIIERSTDSSRTNGPKPRDVRRFAIFEVRDDRGDTLIEVLLSLVILGLAALSMIVAFGTSLTASGQHRNLTTAETYAKTVANHVASNVQAVTSNFLCTSPPTAAIYTGLTSAVALPTGYSAAVTGLSYWNAATSSWGATCVANAPQLISLSVTSPSGAVNTVSVVVDNPAAPTIPVTSTPTKLVFTVPPTGASVGAAMSGQPQLAYEDALGTVANNYYPPTPVTLTVTPVGSSPAATLINCLRQSGLGYVNFSGCEIDTAGTYQLQATDGTFTAAPVTFTVAKGTNAITITSTPPATTLAPSSVVLGSGTTYSPTATALSGDAVVMTSATPRVCSVSPAPATSVTFLTAGVCAINFNDPGNSSWNAAPTLAQGISVYLPNAVTIDSPAPTSAIVNGDTYVPRAHATSGDAVVLSSQSPTICAVNSGVVTFVGAGTCSLDFTDPGNQTYEPAQASQSFSVGKGANAITLSSAPPVPSVYGATYTPSATATSGDNVIVSSSTPGTCKASSGVVMFSHVGSCTINFSDPGNANYVAASQVQQSLTISPASLSVDVSGLQTYGQPPVFTPVYVGLVNGDGNSVVTGTLTCNTNATAVSHPAGGFVITGCSGLSAVNYTLTYVPGTLTVVQAAPRVSWPTPAAIDAATPLGPAQLDASASVPGSMAYSPGSGTLLLPGSQTLNVTFTPTDSIDYSTATASVKITVNKLSQTLSVSASPLSTPWSATSVVRASGQSGTGAVSYYVDSGSNGHASSVGICSVDPTSGVLSATGAGTCEVYATVATDPMYLAASSSDVAVTFTPVTQTLNVFTTPASGPWNTPLSLTSSGSMGTGAVTYQLVGPQGSTLSDMSPAGANTAFVPSASSGVALGAAGPSQIGGNAVSFSGATGSYLESSQPFSGMGAGSISIWFNTTTSGSIMGSSNVQTDAAPTSWDRMLWVDPAGHLVGGVYNNNTDEVTSSATVNDGSWHLATLTWGPTNGEVLYLDGAQVANNPAGSAAQNYLGYWHIGYNSTNYWPDASSSYYFTGSLSHAAVFPTELTPNQVSSLYSANSLATEDSSVLALGPTSYWPLDNTVCSINSAASPQQLVASSPGTCYFTGMIASDTNYLAATSPTASALFTLAPQSISVSVGQKDRNGQYTLSATGQSGSGAIHYLIDSGSSLSCSLSGASGNLLSANRNSTCYVYVSIEPDTLYAGATSNSVRVRF